MIQKMSAKITLLYSWDGGQHLKRPNVVERPIFWNSEISNTKITKVELFHFSIFEFIFYTYIFLNSTKIQNTYIIIY